MQQKDQAITIEIHSDSAEIDAAMAALRSLNVLHCYDPRIIALRETFLRATDSSLRAIAGHASDGYG
jgi:hypothetical protein